MPIERLFVVNIITIHHQDLTTFKKLSNLAIKGNVIKLRAYIHQTL